MTKIHKSREITPLWKLVGDWRSMSIIHAVYEHEAVRYSELQSVLDMSPTTLSKKITELVYYGVISRQSTPHLKEVIYKPTQLAKDIVSVYHTLEEIIRPNGRR